MLEWGDVVSKFFHIQTAKLIYLILFCGCEYFLNFISLRILPCLKEYSVPDKKTLGIQTFDALVRLG